MADISFFGRNDPKMLSILARDLKAKGASTSLTDAAFSLAVLANPTDRLLLADWIDTLRMKHDDEAIFDRLSILQRDHDAPLRSVMIHLRDAKGRDHVEQTLPDIIEKLKNDSFIRAIDDVWKSHYAGEVLADDVYKTVLSSPKFFVDLYFSFICPKIHQLALFSDKIDLAEADSKWGLNLTRLRETVTRILSFDDTEHADSIRRSFVGDDQRREKILSVEAPGFYKYNIIKNGSFEMDDPFSAKTLAAIDSLRIFGRTIYTFKGAELFYLVCGSMGNDLVGIYVPSKDLAISFADKRLSFLSETNTVSLRSELLKRICRMPQAAHAAYHAALEHKKKNIVLHLEKTENFAHHLWNFYSSVDHIVAMGLEKQVTRLIFSGSEFFGPLQKIFPEIAPGVFENPPRSHVVDPCPFSPDEILVGAGSMYMARTLPARIVKAMKTSDRLLDVAKQADSKTSPLIWIGMRLGDKSWVDQQSGIPKLIQHVMSAYPAATFLIDGFSYPEGDRSDVSEWEPFRKEMNAIAEAIIEASPPGAQVVNLVSNTLGESTIWASRVDAYLAPLGTTQHKVGWFSDAKGVVYAPPAFLQNAMNTPGAWAAEISPTPVFVFGEPVEPGKRRGVSRNREKMHNISIDPIMLGDALISLLRERGQTASE